jgi:holo-[acyl-carrier protein] synthase
MKNIGIDIVEHKRFEKIVEDQRRVTRILSEEELIVFNDITSSKRKIEYLASRFAAKEAIIKAINKERLHFSYKDISILNDSNGAPYVKFSFNADFEILISISHSDTNSVAFAVMVGK